MKYKLLYMYTLPDWALWVIVGLAIVLCLCVWNCIETICYYCTCTPCRKCIHCLGCCCRKKQYERI